MTDLELIDTGDLLEEILKRIDAGAFVGVRADEFGEAKHRFYFRYRGDPMTVAGLMEFNKLAMFSEFSKATKPLTGDEPERT